jgi:hypothetical protein
VAAILVIAGVALVAVAVARGVRTPQALAFGTAFLLIAIFFAARALVPGWRQIPMTWRRGGPPMLFFGKLSMATAFGAWGVFAIGISLDWVQGHSVGPWISLLLGSFLFVATSPLVDYLILKSRESELRDSYVPVTRGARLRPTTPDDEADEPPGSFDRVRGVAKIVFSLMLLTLFAILAFALCAGAGQLWKGALGR